MGNYMEDLVLQNTKIIHKNFEGRPGPYNRQGDISFSAVISPEIVDALRAEGWMVKELPPREDVEGSESLFFIPTRVNFDSKRPPEVFLVTRNGLVQLDEKTVATLDHAEIINVDCTLHPHRWENNGKTGVKAYLRHMYVTIREDILAQKYADMYPDVDSGNPEY